MNYKYSFQKYQHLKVDISNFDAGGNLPYLLNKTISFIAYERLSVAKFSYIQILRKFFMIYVFKGLERVLEQKLCVTSVSSRQNYLSLIRNTVKHVNNIDIYTYDVSSSRKINISEAAHSIIWFLRFLFLKRNGWTFKELLFVAGEMAQLRNTLSYLKRTYSNRISAEKLVCFDATFGFDALMVALFKSLEIPTYSLQHSFFFEFTRFVPEEIIKYDVGYPDYYLVWSNQQRNLLVNRFTASSENLLVAGNPNTYKDVKEVKQSFRRCMVLLSRFYYHSENIALLRELSKLKGVTFYVRPHPSLKEIHERIDFNEYVDICNSSNFILDDGSMSFHEAIQYHNLDFSVCFNSAAYFDSLANGLPCLRYSIAENEFVEGLNDRFEDASTLQQKINYFQAFPQEELLGMVRCLLKEEIGIGTFRYSQIL